jgi:hypothetical protein
MSYLDEALKTKKQKEAREREEAAQRAKEREREKRQLTQVKRQIFCTLFKEFHNKGGITVKRAKTDSIWGQIASISLNGYLLGSVYFTKETSRFRPADDCPEQDYDYYLIRFGRIANRHEREDVSSSFDYFADPKKDERIDEFFKGLATFITKKL